MHKERVEKKKILYEIQLIVEGDSKNRKTMQPRTMVSFSVGIYMAE